MIIFRFNKQICPKFPINKFYVLIFNGKFCCRMKHVNLVYKSIKWFLTMPQMKNMSSMYLSQLKWRRKLRSNSGSTFLFEFFHQIQVY